MIERIKRLTDFQETIIVIVIALGLFIYSSLRGLFIISTGTSQSWIYYLNEHSSISILVIELVSLGLIGYLLSKRGWKFSDLNLKFSFKIVLQAILVLFITLVIGGLIFRLITDSGTLDSESLPSVKYERHKNYLIWGLILVINSFFEEFIYVGYLFKKLESHNRGLFIVISSALRTIIHLYQGVLAIIPHLITGLVFGTYYSKYRQLTTLIIAHGLWNLLILWRTG